MLKGKSNFFFFSKNFYKQNLKNHYFFFKNSGRVIFSRVFKKKINILGKKSKKNLV